MDTASSFFLEKSDAIIIIEDKKMSRNINEEKFELANKWLRLQNRNISIFQSLKDRGIEKIIIYGASEFAVRFLEQYDKEDDAIQIIGIVDKKISFKGGDYRNIPLLSINDIADLDMNDTCVVITAMGFYEQILDELHEKGVEDVISLRELIYDAY